VLKSNEGVNMGQGRRIEKVKGDADHKRDQDLQIALIKKGVYMGTKGKITATREELHTRR
jgi:hypothetical protein